MLFEAAVTRPICAVNCTDTARPALSSAGEVIFEPEDKRASDWLNIELDCANRLADVCADMFVFMIILLTPSLSHPFRGFDFHDIPVARRALQGAHPLFLPAVCGRQTPFFNSSVSAVCADT